MGEGQLRAEAELRAIRDALFVLGKPATADEIAALIGSTAEQVGRRLRSCGPSCPRPEWRRFNFDPLAGRWSLTAGSRQEAERAAKP